MDIERNPYDVELSNFYARTARRLFARVGIDPDEELIRKLVQHTRLHVFVDASINNNNKHGRVPSLMYLAATATHCPPLCSYLLRCKEVDHPPDQSTMALFYYSQLYNRQMKYCVLPKYRGESPFAAYLQGCYSNGGGANKNDNNKSILLELASYGYGIQGSTTFLFGVVLTVDVLRECRNKTLLLPVMPLDSETSTMLTDDGAMTKSSSSRKMATLIYRGGVYKLQFNFANRRAVNNERRRLKYTQTHYHLIVEFTKQNLHLWLKWYCAIRNIEPSPKLVKVLTTS